MTKNKIIKTQQEISHEKEKTTLENQNSYVNTFDTKSHSSNEKNKNESSTLCCSEDNVSQEKESEYYTSERSSLSQDFSEKQKEPYSETKINVSDEGSHSTTNYSSVSSFPSEQTYPLLSEMSSTIFSNDTLPREKERVQRKPFGWLRSTSSSGIISPFTRSSISTSLNFSFAFSSSSNPPPESLSNTLKTTQRPLLTCKASKTSTEILQENFEKIYQQASNDRTIDWEFFRLVVSDYNFVTKFHQEELTNVISSGIPPILRGIIWQVMTSSKNLDMEHIYHTLVDQTTPNEKLIRRDLHRTFPKAILKAMEQYSYDI